MFGLLYAEYVQGSALRTWNCVSRIANTVWYKFNHLRDPIMPRSRRRHHSRSRSRSRSHSHDRDREPKRRKVDSYDSPHHRRSVSSEPEDQSDNISATPLDDTQPSETDVSLVTADEMETPKKTSKPRNSIKLTPKQVEKRKESEKRRQEKLEDLEKKKKLKEIKEQQKLEKMKEKEKILKEKEDKKKEKEMKRKEREELKRKEKEQENFEKQQKIDEKNKEKQKMEKTAAAFTKFFKKLPENDVNDKVEIMTVKGSINFMPFEKKADMKLAPITRSEISINGRNDLDQLFKEQSTQNLYLNELKNGKKPKTFGKTWSKLDDSDDVVIIGETIEDEKHKIQKMRAKYLMFNENQRPAYYGTFRKTSKIIRGRKPFNKDIEKLDYEVDSEEEWEEEPEGESLKGTDDEDEEKDDKENEANDDYEVDNEFFVPHGHLSDDEIDDEAEKRLDPEMHKAKLKLLKNEFDEERRLKTLKIRPVIIGACWQGKVKDSTAQNSITKYLAPFSLITSNEKIDIQERNTIIVGSVGKRKIKPPLNAEQLPLFLKFIHGRSVKGKELIKRFIEGLESQGIDVQVSRNAIAKQLRLHAEWTNKEEGVKKKCWIVKEEFQKKFNLDSISCKVGDVPLKTP